MTLLAASCQKGLLGGQREIIPVVSSTVMTKASSDQNDAEQLLFSVPLDADNGEEYTLEAWVSDTPSNVPETKGTPVTTGNIQDVYGSFKTTAFCGGQPYSGLQEATVTYSNSEWAFDNVYYWPSDGSSLTFCSVAPIGTWNNQVSNLSWNNGTEATFTYTLPSPNGSSDAFNQDDLLIAMDTQSAGTSGEAEINFHHALTFVDFIVGSLKDVTINSISLKNFYGTGTCTYTPGSTPSFSWSSPSNKNTYVQAFGQKIESSTNDGYSIGDWSKTFMMIPQQLPSDAEIVITYNTDKTVSYKIGADNTTKDKSGNIINNWSPYAGKSITFKVNREIKYEGVDVVVIMDMSKSLSSYSEEWANNVYKARREQFKSYYTNNFIKPFIGNTSVRIAEGYFTGAFSSSANWSSTSNIKTIIENGYSVGDNSYMFHHFDYVTNSNYSSSSSTFGKMAQSSSSGTKSAAFVGLQEAFWEFYYKGDQTHKYIIVFLSDGWANLATSSDETNFDANTANLAISADNSFSHGLSNTTISATAKQIKDGKTQDGKTVKADIYSVYLTSPKGSKYSDDSRNLMKAISSDYPNATSLTNMGSSINGGYYQEIPADGNLTTIFTNIVKAIKATPLKK